MKLMIYFENRQRAVPVTYDLKMLIRRALLATLLYEKVGGACEISVTFTDNDGIRELNKRYREIDRPTDVLSFPQLDFAQQGADRSDDSYKVLGDIVISLERAREQAKELMHSSAHETAFLCVHSALHLLGYDHVTTPEDERRMTGKQRAIIKILEKDLEYFDKESKR